MALTSLSLRAYAKHRKAQGLPGGSLQAVQRAVQAERITVGPDGRIPDVGAADREWAANTDHTRAPGWVKDMADGSDDEDEGGSSLSKASAREKHWKAQTAQLNYLERAGVLVNAEEVQAGFVDLCTTTRNKVLGVTNRMKQAHPELTHAQLATLDAFLREALEELAGGDEA